MLTLHRPHTNPQMQRGASTGFVGDVAVRWWLERRWGKGSGSILWIGHNPSLANAVNDDPTLIRMMEFTAQLGYQSLQVCNLIPAVSPKPETAHAFVKYLGGVWIKSNVGKLVGYASSAEKTIVCWGEIARPVKELVDIVYSQLYLAGIQPLCLGTTVSGAPIHPLARGKNRVPYDVAPRRWSAGSEL